LTPSASCRKGKHWRERAAEAKRLPASPLDRLSLFRDRGVSLDTGIFPGYRIEHTLRDLKNRGVLREGKPHAWR